MLKFDEQAITQKLKMEIGLSDVPDMDLWKHKVILNSPVKGDDEFSMNAAEYVSKGLEEWRIAIEQTNQEIKDDIDPEEYNIKPLDSIPQLEVPKPEKSVFRVFDVSHGLDSFVVGVNMEHPDAITNIEIIQSNFTYAKERQIEDLTAFDRPLSYYQWHTWMSQIDRPVSTGIFDMEDFEKKLNFTFEGVEDTGLEQAKRFL
jgi:hypothetical protein